MKALSIKQPWVWAIFYRGKDIENRTRKNSFRGHFLIHASKKVDMDTFGYWFGQDTEPAIVMPTGAIVGSARITDCVTEHESQWFEGPYGFVLKDLFMFQEPIECKGALGFWQVPPEIEAEARIQAEQGDPRVPRFKYALKRPPEDW